MVSLDCVAIVVSVVLAFFFGVAVLFRGVAAFGVVAVRWLLPFTASV